MEGELQGVLFSNVAAPWNLEGIVRKRGYFIIIAVMMVTLWIICEAICLNGVMGYGSGKESRVALLYFLCIGVGLIVLGTLAADRRLYLRMIGGICIAAVIILVCYALLIFFEATNTELGTMLTSLFMMGSLLFANPLVILTEEIMKLIGLSTAGHLWIVWTCIFYAIFFLCGWVGTRLQQKEKL